MRIGIDIRSLSEERLTGVGEYLYRLLSALFKIDKKNTYILFYNSLRRPPKLLNDFKRPNVSIHYTRFPNKLFNASLFFLRFPKIDRMIGGVDLFFIPNHNFLALSKNCRTVITVHDLSFVLFKEFLSLKRQLWHKIILLQNLYKKVDQIIAVSNHTKNDLINLFGVPKEKIITIYSGVGSEYKQNFVRMQLSRVVEKYGLPERFILYLGTLEPRKNIEAIINAYEQYIKSKESLYDYERGKIIDLVIAGQQGWKYGTILEKKRQSPFKDRIHLIGYVDAEDKPYLYRLCDVFIYPSFYEGFGFPVLEAMAVGKPVISSSSSALEEVICDAGLLVNPYNISELVQALDAILAEKDMRDYLVLRGIDRVKQFSWQECAIKTLELFENLML